MEQFVGNDAKYHVKTGGNDSKSGEWMKYVGYQDKNGEWIDVEVPPEHQNQETYPEDGQFYEDTGALSPKSENLMDSYT